MNHLLLFDIDGTLVSGGPAKAAFHTALVHAFGTAGDIEVHDFSGKTDPQIARELLVGSGLSDEEVDAGLPRLFARYLEEMEARLPSAPMRVLPGVQHLVSELLRLSEQARVGLGLVTGNVAGGADLKLGSTGLRAPFEVGGFGSDSEERNDLPGVALARARERWSVDFAPDRVWVVGDTPRDVACGHAHGLRTLAVATGSFDADTLERAGADAVLDDFSHPDRVLEILELQ
jgi:phosphoglycolate phosphatase-like HAD superfamily hydrolase